MTRRRLYNPAHLNPDELKASFVAREDTLAEMLRMIDEQKPGHPCQHMMLIGARGMGKTTLGLRFLHEILDTPTLAAIWQPVPFHEESYGISNLAEFWLAALHHLTRATGDPRWADQAEALAGDERDDNRLAAYAVAALMDFCQASGRRLILFVENIDTVFKQLGDERQIHELRATLIERPEILLLGSANTVFEAIQSHGEPLYEFFRLFILKGLSPEDTRRILATLAEDEDRAGIMGTLDRERGRLETIRRMTDGNPRLILLACRILIESPLGPGIEALERLIDEQTPYFKARIEELPGQARKVFHCLADGWKPMQSKEVAEAANLSSSHASAQLKQLMEKGYAREVTLPNAKRTLYEVGDRFYNIYYLLRFSRSGRQRLERLVSFLHDLFGPTGMRTMYPATLAAFHTRGPSTEEAADLLGVLARYVAQDEDFEGREDWRNSALDLTNQMLGPSATVIAEINKAFTRELPSDTARFTELIRRANTLRRIGRFSDAEALVRTAAELRPYDASVWMFLGWALTLQERHDEALDAFDRAQHHAPLNDTPVSRSVTFGALVGRGLALLELNRREGAVKALGGVAEVVHVDDPSRLRHGLAESLNLQGKILMELGRHEEAVEAWERVPQYVRLDDSPNLRHAAAKSLRARGDVLCQTDQCEEAIEVWQRVLEYVRKDDPRELRSTLISALIGKFRALLSVNRDEECNAAFWLEFSRYVRTDDPPELCRTVATALAIGGELLTILGHWTDAEATCCKATTIDPTHDESWRVLAEAILGQDDAARLAEAVDFARRAVKLAPHSSIAFHTLSDILARRGDWTEALSALERALHIGSEDLRNQQHSATTESLIRAAAAGHVPQVKRIMEELGLSESMEPLWHAVRAELGEELEPLPTEIMEAVTDIRREFARNPEAPSDGT